MNHKGGVPGQGHLSFQNLNGGPSQLTRPTISVTSDILGFLGYERLIRKLPSDILPYPVPHHAVKGVYISESDL